MSESKSKAKNLFNEVTSIVAIAASLFGLFVGYKKWVEERPNLIVPNPVMSVTPSNGIAKLRLVSWGAFTVGVETDNKDNQLELDLAELPEAPQKFKEL